MGVNVEATITRSQCTLTLALPLKGLKGGGNPSAEDWFHP
jgi:hypothetical protein